MKLVMRIAVFAGLFLLLASAASADWYARGAYYNGWAADDGNRLNDDGLNGDAVAGDGIFSRLVTATEVAGDYDFKIAVEDWSVSHPTSNVWLSLSENNQAILFTFNTNIVDDGWYPNTNIVWADALRMGTVWGLVGEPGELGGWDPAGGPLATMVDDLWQVEVEFAAAGVYPYKWTADQDWGVQQLGNDGVGSNAQNVSLNVVEPGSILFKMDPATGRGWHGAPPPPPPTWHARGAYYSDWTADDGNLLNDDGLNGDAVAGDGIFSGFVTSTEPAGDYEFKVGRSDWSESYPGSNVFLTLTEDNQTVFFTFDTNLHEDGSYPATNIVWADAVRQGAWGLVGGADELGNWDPASGPVAMQNGDVWEALVVFAAAGNYEYKWTSDQVWDVQQLGNDGYGNNAQNVSLTVDLPGDYRFVYDTLTGRGYHEFVPPVPVEETSWGKVKQNFR